MFSGCEAASIEQYGVSSRLLVMAIRRFIDILCVDAFELARNDQFAYIVVLEYC